MFCFVRLSTRLGAPLIACGDNCCIQTQQLSPRTYMNIHFLRSFSTLTPRQPPIPPLVYIFFTFTFTTSLHPISRHYDFFTFSFKFSFSFFSTSFWFLPVFVFSSLHRFCYRLASSLFCVLQHVILLFSKSPYFTLQLFILQQTNSSSPTTITLHSLRSITNHYFLSITSNHTIRQPITIINSITSTVQ